MNEATFWFTTVITVIILVIPVLAWRFYFIDVRPTLSDRVRLKQRLAQLRYVYVYFKHNSKIFIYRVNRLNGFWNPKIQCQIHSGARLFIYISPMWESQ
jgi:hypothetical protein